MKNVWTPMNSTILYSCNNCFLGMIRQIKIVKFMCVEVLSMKQKAFRQTHYTFSILTRVPSKYNYNQARILQKLNDFNYLERNVLPFKHNICLGIPINQTSWTLNSLNINIMFLNIYRVIALGLKNSGQASSVIQ